MSEVHEEYKKLGQNMAKINTQRGKQADRLKGFYAELANSTEDNVERINKGIGARQRVLDNNGPADAVIQYSNGSYGRQIQDKCGYGSSEYKKFIKDGKYDGMILRINNDNPLFSNQKQLESLTNLAREHNIKIEKSRVSADEMQKVAKAANMEGQLRNKIGLDQTAPVTSGLYAGSKELGYRAGKAEERLQNIGAEVASKTDLAIDAAKNIGSDFASGAVDAMTNAAFPLMVLGVQNICEVASGQKSMEEARSEMGEVTLKIAVSGGGGNVISKAAHELAEKTGSEIFGFVSRNANKVVQIMNVGMVVFKSFNKLINDEISGVEFFDEIGEQGVGLIGDFVGTLAGAGLADILIPAGMATGPAGFLVGATAFIGGMIVSTVCVAMYRNAINLREKYRAMNEAYQHRIAELNRVMHMAIQEIEHQREQLSGMIKKEYAEWENRFDMGFKIIMNGMFNNDFEKLSQGLNHILETFGETVLFKNMEEFDEFFFDDNAVLTI